MADEDDAKSLLAQIGHRAGTAPLGEVITKAWLRTRQRFLAFAAREEAVSAAGRADDLDAGLRDAARPDTAAQRLVELAASPYPRVRALVAAHAGTPPSTVKTLAEDPERTVREAAAANASARETASR